MWSQDPEYKPFSLGLKKQEQTRTNQLKHKHKPAQESSWNSSRHKEGIGNPCLFAKIQIVSANKNQPAQGHAQNSTRTFLKQQQTVRSTPIPNTNTFAFVVRMSSGRDEMCHGRLYLRNVPLGWTWWDVSQWVQQQGLPQPAWIHVHGGGCDMTSLYIHYHCTWNQVAYYCNQLNGH